MTHRRVMPRDIHRVSALFLVLVIVAHLSLQPGRVRAGTPTLLATPLVNLPHNLETIIGTGFSPLAAVALMLANSTGTTSIGSVQSDATGAISTTVKLPFALDANTNNILTAAESGSGATASTAIQGLPVIPSLANALRLAGSIADTVTIYAAGFAPGDPITLMVNGALASPPSGAPPLIANAFGVLNSQFVVPIDAQAGPGQIVLSGAVTGEGQHDSVAAAFNVTGSQNLVVTPSPARAGRVVQISAAGFAAGEMVTISFRYHDSASGGTAIATASAQASGAGSLHLNFTIPGTAAGGNQGVFTATGETSGLAIGATVLVLQRPLLTSVPPGAEPGSQIGVTGTGFSPGERFFLSTALFRTPGAGLEADATGAFSATYTIRALMAPGRYSIAAAGALGDRAEAIVTVPPPQAPHLVVVPKIMSPGDNMRVEGDRFLASEPVALALDATPIVSESGPITTSVTGAFSATVHVPPVSHSGIYLMTAQGQLTGATGSTQISVKLPLVSKTYFAEGFTGDGPPVRFDETLTVLNTSPITADGQIEYYLSSGITSTVHITVPAHQRLDQDVGQDVGRNHPVSALVELDHNVVVTRSMTRTDVAGDVLEPSISSGVNSLSQFWYFAEGYTGVTFQEYLAMFNPGSAPVHVMVQTFSKSGSSQVAPLSWTVPAHSRITVNVRAALPNQSLGLLIQADQPIAAERVLYWGSGSGSAKYGTSATAGLSRPSSLWTFPYASTANGDQVFLSLVDPTTVAARVQFTEISDRGTQTQLPSTTVGPGARVTIVLPPRLDGGPVAVIARSDVPIVIEEAQYFTGSPNTSQHAGSVVAGTSSGSQATAFAGYASDQFATEGWYVLNMGIKDAAVTATIFRAGQTPVISSHIAPAARLTRIDLESAHKASSDTAITWVSDQPVFIVHVLHGAEARLGAVLAGHPIAVP